MFRFLSFLTFIFILSNVSYAETQVVLEKHIGTVIGHYTTGGYIYLEVEEASGNTWVATPEIAIDDGEQIEFLTAEPIKDFVQKTTGKKFDEIYFSQSVRVLREKEPVEVSNQIPESITKPEEVQELTPEDKINIEKICKFASTQVYTTWIAAGTGISRESSSKRILTALKKKKIPYIDESMVANGLVDEFYNMYYQYGKLNPKKDKRGDLEETYFRNCMKNLLK